jgi:phosphoenolpyruvate---glycerone phosphotransferase subunit DhaK
VKTFINSADTMLAESLNGFSLAHSDMVTHVADGNFIRRKTLNQGKVSVISGGGSGHEPLHCGFVGLGMLDAACPGHMFTSPTPDQMAKAALATDTGAGCIFIVKNYAGDVMNFDMGADLVQGGARQIIVSDDVATGKNQATRRGLAGTLIVQKIVGAAAERGMPLEQLFALGTRVNEATRSIGVALNGSYNPVTKRQSFPLKANEIEFGVGIHGEPGAARINMKPADEIAADMCAPILADLKHGSKRPALLFVNGLGATPLGELYLMYHAARRIFEASGITIARSLVGNYVTSLNMTGCSITLTAMDDDILGLWDAPVMTPCLRWGA